MVRRQSYVMAGVSGLLSAVRLDRIDRSWKTARREWESLAGVYCVGLSIDPTADIPAHTVSIHVCVNADSEERLRTRIPKKWEGLPVVVERPIEVQPPGTVSDDDEPDRAQYRPLQGGSNIVGKQEGTLGCFVTDAVPTEGTYALTCAHVLYGNDGEDGDIVGQPDFEHRESSYDSCTYDHRIGTSLRKVDTDETDAAVAKLYDTVDYNIEILDIGEVTDSMDPTLGLAVIKRGMKTRLTDGWVVAVNRGISIGNQVKRGSFWIADSHFNAFSLDGDSGALVVRPKTDTEGNKAVGMIVQGFYDNRFGYVGVATPIIKTLEDLHVTLTTSSTQRANPPVPPTLHEKTWERYKKRLNRFPLGRQYVKAIETHYEEVRDLVHHKRPVKVAWHRNNGPDFVAANTGAAVDENKPITKEIDGESAETLLTVMRKSLDEYGSKALKKSIQKFYPQLGHFYAFDTVADIQFAMIVDFLRTLVDTNLIAALKHIDPLDLPPQRFGIETVIGHITIELKKIKARGISQIEDFSSSIDYKRHTSTGNWMTKGFSIAGELVIDKSWVPTLTVDFKVTADVTPTATIAFRVEDVPPLVKSINITADVTDVHVEIENLIWPFDKIAELIADAIAPVAIELVRDPVCNEISRQVKKLVNDEIRKQWSS